MKEVPEDFESLERKILNQKPPQNMFLVQNAQICRACIDFVYKKQKYLNFVSWMVDFDYISNENYSEG